MAHLQKEWEFKKHWEQGLACAASNACQQGAPSKGQRGFSCIRLKGSLDDTGCVEVGVNPFIMMQLKFILMSKHVRYLALMSI